MAIARDKNGKESKATVFDKPKKIEEKMVWVVVDKRDGEIMDVSEERAVISLQEIIKLVENLSVENPEKEGEWVYEMKKIWLEEMKDTLLTKLKELD